MASEGKSQGTNRDGERKAPDKRARHFQGGGIAVSPYRIVVIRDGQFVTAAPRRSKAL